MLSGKSTLLPPLLLRSASDAGWSHNEEGPAFVTTRVDALSPPQVAKLERALRIAKAQAREVSPVRLGWRGGKPSASRRLPGPTPFRLQP